MDVIVMKRPLKGAWRWVLIVVLLIVLVDFIVFPIKTRNVMFVIGPENLLRVGFKFFYTLVFLICTVKISKPWAQQLMFFDIMLVLSCHYMYGGADSMIGGSPMPIVSLLVLFICYDKKLAFMALITSFLCLIGSILVELGAGFRIIGSTLCWAGEEYNIHDVCPWLFEVQ